MKLIAYLFTVLSLVGCSISPSLNDPKLSDKELNLEEFFDGEITAYGQFQDALQLILRLK
jgi:hypothetical protein